MTDKNRLFIKRLLYLSVLLVLATNFMLAQNASIIPVGISPFKKGEPYWIEVKIGDPQAVANLYGIISVRLKVE